MLMGGLLGATLFMSIGLTADAPPRAQGHVSRDVPLLAGGDHDWPAES